MNITKPGLIAATGHADALNSSSLSGNLEVGGNVSVGKDASFNDGLDVVGGVSFGNRLDVVGGVSFGNRLDVVGGVSLNSNISIKGNASICYGSTGGNDSSGITLAPFFPCRVWVLFDGIVNTTTWSAGNCYATRASGSTTVTVTTDNPHGLLVGHYVYADPAVSGGIAESSYLVTAVTENTFTFETPLHTTLMTNQSILFSFATIKGHGGVHSVASNSSWAAAGVYTINFKNNMPDTSYCVVFGSPVYNTGNVPFVFQEVYNHSGVGNRSRTVSSVTVASQQSGNLYNTDNVQACIFR